MTGAERERLMYDPRNLEPLCHDCHVRTHTEAGRSGREVTRQRNAARTASANARFYGEDTDGGRVF